MEVREEEKDKDLLDITKKEGREEGREGGMTMGTRESCVCPVYLFIYFITRRRTKIIKNEI